MTRILILDDSRMILKTVKALLCNYVVETLDNPLLLPSVIRSFNPDWILLDFEMPTINGADVLVTIESTGLIPMSRIIMFSSSKSAEPLVARYGLAGFSEKKLDRVIEIIEAAS